MRSHFHTSKALRGLCLFSFVALSLFVGRRELRGGNAQTQKESDNPHSVTITWTASKSQVEGYNVYRESQSRGRVKLTTNLVSGAQYTDRTVEAGHTYSYYVTSVDFKGMESSPSEKITVTVPTTAAPPAKH